jgi:head-tail adaptor
MKAENHRTLGVFERRTGSLDSFGQRADTWTEVARGALDIRTITTREKLRGGALSSELTHTVSMRYDPRLLPMAKAADLRIRVEDTMVSPSTRVFNVAGGQDVDEKHEWFLFDCMEGSLDGD